MTVNIYFHMIKNVFWLTLILLTMKVPVVVAEVVTDGTVKGARAIALDENLTYQIAADDGRLVGTNLYHSFETFDINSGETANFLGSAAISDIIARVTGGSGSTIAGTIKSDIPEVNLWLFNPAGILFKEGASVDIGGSFHVATADFIGLKGGERFGVTTTKPSVLTIGKPETFGFVEEFSDSTIASKTLNFQNTNINIPNGDFTAIGSDVVLQNTRVNTPNGIINVAAVGGPGEARLDNGQLDVTEFDQLGDVLEENAALTAKTPGDVNIVKFTEPEIAIRDGVILLEYLPDSALNEKMDQLEIAKVATHLAVIDQPCEQLVANTFLINFLIEKQGDEEGVFLVSQREAGITSDVSSDAGCQ